MTDLTQIPVPNDGPIANKVLEIYERSFPPEEQVPMSELRRSTERDEVSFLAWIDPSLPAGEDGAGNVIALTFSFVFPDLFYLGIPQLLEIEPLTREAANYQQRMRRLAFYERNGFTVTNMITHEADQTYRVLARGGIVTPERLEEALNSVTDDPAYASHVTTD